MANKEKAKGNRFERECVEVAEQHGFSSTRAWGSNGQSLGLDPEVDMTIEYLLSDEISRQMKVQCKVRKNIAKYLLPPDSCDITLIKQDRGEIYATIRYKDLLELIQLTFQLN
jgi:Holliday junction resolvase|tara:strand:+ start:138 stop:476 length:339 start_codon:yes stop_codon:yes gene_type:complete